MALNCLKEKNYLNAFSLLPFWFLEKNNRHPITVVSDNCEFCCPHSLWVPTYCSYYSQTHTIDRFGFIRKCYYFHKKFACKTSWKFLSLFPGIFFERSLYVPAGHFRWNLKKYNYIHWSVYIIINVPHVYAYPSKVTQPVW